MSDLRIRPELPPLPERMRHLPVDDRGYPVPWFVVWQDDDGKPSTRGEGRPDFRLQMEGALAEAWNGKRCWLCGGRTGRFVAFVIGPMCALNRVTGEPPSHRDCADYAAKACPFLTRPHARRRSIEDLDVSQAGTPILRNPGVTAVWVTERRRATIFRAQGGHLFDVGEPTAVGWYSHGRPATREECARSIAAGLPMLREELGDAPAAETILDDLLRRAQRWLPAQEVVVGG